MASCANVVQRGSHFFFFFFLCRTSAITSAGSAQTWPGCFISIRGPDTSSRLERQRLSSPCIFFIFFIFFCICPPLCPSVKIRDLSHFGDSSSFSRVAFSADSRKTARKDLSFGAKRVNRIDDQCNQVRCILYFFAVVLMCFRTSSDVINRREFGAGPRFWRHFFS